MKGGMRHQNGSWRRNNRDAGFTIVEVMIVLAISGVLFASVMLMLSGRQATAQFNQSINNVKTEFEQIAGEVENGYFGDPGAVVCYNNGGGAPINRSNCTYNGKLIQFRSGDTQYAVHTLIGDRMATTFADSDPYTAQSVLEMKQLSFGLEVVWMRSGATNLSAVGIVSQFGTDASGNASGSRAVMIAPYQGNLTTSFASLEQQSMPPSFSQASNMNPAAGVQICFRSGTTNQSGLITLGAANAGRTVDLAIKNTGDCS